MAEARREPAATCEGVRAAGLARGPAGVRDRAGRARPDLPRDPLEARCRRRSARSPTGSATAPRCCCSPRAWSRRRASCPPSTSASGCGRARSPASAAPPTPARPSPARRRWCSAPPTPTCATSSARSSTAPAWSASAPATSSASRWPGAAKNAAALAAAAAEPHGLNAAGIAAAEIWRECIEYAIAPRRRAGDLRRAGRRRRPDRDGDGARPAATAAPASCSGRGTPGRARSRR